MTSTAIIIPARYGSTRFPGKPLAMIAGKTLLQRVVLLAQKALQDLPNAQVLVATDNARIRDHADMLGVASVMTPAECPTGSDRVLAAAKQLPQLPDILVNLQGDAPLTPPRFLRQLIQTLIALPQADAATPVAPLSWAELDALRNAKLTTPFSGTTAVVDAQGKALWFSKNILPALRKEAEWRKSDQPCPVLRHIGLYAYRTLALERFVTLPEGRYEALEGLEQLRLLEHGMHLQTVTVDYGPRPSASGVDTPEDARRIEALLAQYGDPLDDPLP